MNNKKGFDLAPVARVGAKLLAFCRTAAEVWLQRNHRTGVSITASAEQPSGSSTFPSLDHLKRKERYQIAPGFPWILDPQLRRQAIVGAAVGLLIRQTVPSKKWSIESNSVNIKKVIEHFGKTPAGVTVVSVTGAQLKATQSYPRYMCALLAAALCYSP